MSNSPSINILDTVNAGRVAWGLEPLSELPRGKKSSETHCPLARAFAPVGVYGRVRVTNMAIRGVDRSRAPQLASAIGGTLASSNGEASITLPHTLSQFTIKFDRGHYPSLVE